MPPEAPSAASPPRAGGAGAGTGATAGSFGNSSRGSSTLSSAYTATGGVEYTLLTSLAALVHPDATRILPAA